MLMLTESLPDTENLIVVQFEDEISIAYRSTESFNSKVPRMVELFSGTIIQLPPTPSEPHIVSGESKSSSIRNSESATAPFVKEMIANVAIETARCRPFIVIARTTRS